MPITEIIYDAPKEVVEDGNKVTETLIGWAILFNGITMHELAAITDLPEYKEIENRLSAVRSLSKEA